MIQDAISPARSEPERRLRFRQHISLLLFLAKTDITLSIDVLSTLHWSSPETLKLGKSAPDRFKRMLAEEIKNPKARCRNPPNFPWQVGKWCSCLVPSAPLLDGKCAQHKRIDVWHSRCTSGKRFQMPVEISQFDPFSRRLSRALTPQSPDTADTDTRQYNDGVCSIPIRAWLNTNVQLGPSRQTIFVAPETLWKAGRCAAALGTASEAVWPALPLIRRCFLEDGATSRTCQEIHTELSQFLDSSNVGKILYFDAPIRSAYAW